MDHFLKSVGASGKRFIESIFNGNLPEWEPNTETVVYGQYILLRSLSKTFKSKIQREDNTSLPDDMGVFVYIHLS